VIRRAFLGHGLTLVLAATGRKLLAQVPLRFRPLSRPVVVAVGELATPGRARPFTAGHGTGSEIEMAADVIGWKFLMQRGVGGGSEDHGFPRTRRGKRTRRHKTKVDWQIEASSSDKAG